MPVQLPSLRRVTCKEKQRNREPMSWGVCPMSVRAPKLVKSAEPGGILGPQDLWKAFPKEDEDPSNTNN